MTLESLSQKQIESLAAAIGKLAKKGDLICLSGPLGAGKTTMARAMIRQLLSDPEAEVPSPSYTLAQFYKPIRGDGAAIWHFDFYRIEDTSEITELGLDEALGEGIVLVEWAERAGPALEDQGLLITITLATEARQRHLEIKGFGDWPDRLDAIKAFER